jgi:hypothetical protein
MTRRVRFTPLVCAGLFAAAVLPSGRASASDLPLVRQPNVAEGTHVSDAFVVDVDRDGDADLVAAGAGNVHWYENAGGSFTQRTIATVGLFTLAAAAVDVDSDGDVDVLTAGAPANVVLWHENTAGNGSAWTTHTLGTADQPRELETGDLDGDGDLDVLVGSLNRVAWLENTGAPSAWPVRTIISFAVALPQSVVSVDLDRDGDLDVATVDTQLAPTSVVYWAENTAGNGTAWTLRSAGTAAGGALVAAADLDGDGDPDLLAGYSGAQLRWFENAAGNASAWTMRTIAVPPGTYRVATGDLDGDGDQDILAGVAATAADQTFWLENTAGNASAWTRRTVAGSEETIPSALVSRDIDGDGDHDFLLGTGGTDRLIWFRNDSIHRSACFAPAAAVFTSALNVPEPVTVADLDGDGALDVVSYAHDLTSPILWHENAAADGSAWVSHTLSTGTNQVNALASADVDRDGDADVLSTDSTRRISWHENLGGAGSWTRHTIGQFASPTPPIALRVADLDRDGDSDALVLAQDTTSLRWFVNTGAGATWTERTLCDAASVCFGTALAVGDFDRDGTVDAATSATFFEGRLRWYPNVPGVLPWIPQLVAAGAPFPEPDLAAGDLDGDGKLDLMGAFRNAPVVGLRWFANGVGGTWTPRTVSLTAPRRVVLGDLDRDGDLDAAATGEGADAVAWHENEGGGLNWAAHTLATAPPGASGIAAGDLDRDGDLDLVAARPGDHRIDWFANRGGQFSLSAADIAPPGAPNSALVAMLRVVATHLGRAGDGSLELAQLGLRLEEAAGDPLTNAEANALIESLRIYADANGSGAFEPGSDELVLSVPTLALVGGVQAMPLEDGNPNVQVVFGTPRTYFVVAELTANANTQPVHQFRVSLLGLGAFASTAEDRTYDIALEPACPADVASSVMGATPVALIRFDVE